MPSRSSLLAYLKADRLQGYSITGNAGLALTPGQVINLTALGRVIDIVTGWNVLTGATGYKLYRSLTSVGGYSLIATLSGGGTNSYTDSTSITAGVEYYYQVKGFNAFGDGIFSNVAHAHTQSVFSSFSFIAPVNSRVWVQALSGFTFLAGDSIVIRDYLPISNPVVSPAIDAYVYPEGFYNTSTLPFYARPTPINYANTLGYPNIGTGFKITDCRPWSCVMAIYDSGVGSPAFPTDTSHGVYQAAFNLPITGLPVGTKSIAFIMNSSMGWGGGASDDFHGLASIYR